MVLFKDAYDAEFGLTQSLFDKSFTCQVLASSFCLLPDHNFISVLFSFGDLISDLQEAPEKRGRLGFLLKQRVELRPFGCNSQFLPQFL